MDTTFDTASRVLQRLAVPAYPEVHDRLVGLVRIGQIVEAFKQCFPEKLPRIGKLSLLEVDDGKLFELQQAAISAVAALFPVLEDYMEMVLEEDEPLRIHPDSCGFAWDDEWLSEVFQDPSQLAPDTDLAMFFKTLWIATTQFGAEDGRHLWETMRDHFGYPCEMPEVGKTVYARDFNWQALSELLEQAGLGEFKRVIDLALCDTGNLFLDTNPDEYGYGTVAIPDFTAENIQELSQLWREAEQWLADYAQCRKQVLAEPEIYARLAHIWESAWRTQSSPGQQKTLFEVFGEGEPDGNHPTLP
jgi:hypothetical protein